MMHVRGRAASKDDLELARRSALTQEKISFGVTHVEPMGGYGRPRSTVTQKRPATAQTRRPTRPTSARARPQSAQVQRSRPASAPRSAAQHVTRGDASAPHRTCTGVLNLQRGRISPDLIDDAPAEPAEDPPRIYDASRGRSYLPAAHAPAEGIARPRDTKPTSRLTILYQEKVPRVACAVPLSMPEVDTQGGTGSASKLGAQRYPDVLLLESWMDEMAERVLVNKQQEVFSKVMFDRSLLSYTMDAKHGEAEVHNMWRTAHQGLGRFGCTRDQLYARHMDSAAVERLYRALYIYSVGLPTAVLQVTEAAARKEPTTGAGLPVLALSTFLHIFMEVLKSIHGDIVATQVEDHFVAGVHARVQAYIASLDALKAEHEALQQRAAALQAEVDDNSGESSQQKIQRMNEAIYDLQQKMKAMMKSQAAALAQKEDELENAEREAREAKKREAEAIRLAAVERQQAASREQDLQADIARIKAEQVSWQSDMIRYMETMVDDTRRLRNEQWVSSGGPKLPTHAHGSGPELVEAHATAVASIVQAVATEREDVLFQKERDEKAREIKEMQRDRELQEERKAADEALLEQQTTVRREKDAKERLENQLARAELVFARERATVKDCLRCGKQLAVHQFAKLCVVNRQLRLTQRSLHSAEKAAELAIKTQQAALAAQENERDRRKTELGESLESQHKQLAAMLAEVEILKFELQDSKAALASKQELQRQADAGHRKIRELLAEIERLNSAHSGEMATREIHIGKIEVQLQAAHNSSDSAAAELRQARAEHAADVVQASERREKLLAELDKVKSAKTALAKSKAEAAKRQLADKQTVAYLEAKLASVQSHSSDLQTKLRADVDRLEKAVRKAESARQQTEQQRKQEGAHFQEERAALQKQIDDHAEKLAKVNSNLAQQRRIFNALKDDRDLVQATCHNLEQSLVAEKRNVFDAHTAKSDAEAQLQRLRREVKTIEDDRDAAIERVKRGEESRKLLEQKIEVERLPVVQLDSNPEVEARHKTKTQADVLSTADIGVQASDGTSSDADLLEQLRITESACERAQKHYAEAKKSEREALQLRVALKENIARLEAELARVTRADDKRGSRASASKNTTRTVASDFDNTHTTDLEDAELMEQGVDTQPSSELPDNLSSLMHGSPPECVRHMSLPSVLSIVRKLYAHCSGILQECVGPSMQSIGECIYQFFELKYGRVTLSSRENKYPHELHIYEFISNVLRLEHESPALELFARFAGVVEQAYSVQAFRFFLYVLSCLDTSLIDQAHGGQPKAFTGKRRDLGPTAGSGGQKANQIWLSEEYALQIFQKVIPDSTLLGIMQYELRSVLSHRPSRRDCSTTACVQHDIFLLKVMQLWNEVTPAENGGSMVKKRGDMFLRRDDSGGVNEDIAALFLDRWISLGRQAADGAGRRKSLTQT